jgi:hypothetical protein
MRLDPLDRRAPPLMYCSTVIDGPPASTYRWTHGGPGASGPAISGTIGTHSLASSSQMVRLP